MYIKEGQTKAVVFRRPNDFCFLPGFRNGRRRFGRLLDGGGALLPGGPCVLHLRPTQRRQHHQGSLTRLDQRWREASRVDQRCGFSRGAFISCLGCRPGLWQGQVTWRIKLTAGDLKGRIIWLLSWLTRGARPRLLICRIVGWWGTKIHILALLLWYEWPSMS